MRLWVVRHGCAGQKEDWRGEDADRPLDPVGLSQATALAPLLAGEMTALQSSPTKRCIDTLAPLSATTGIPIETDRRLGTQQRGLASLINEGSVGGAVLCTHGEVMQPALYALRAQGLRCDLTDEELLMKGAAWDLTQEPDGTWTLDLLAPMPRLTCPNHRMTI